MYKIKSTKREVREASYRVLSVGYCEAQYLLRAEEPVAYCGGYYGWSCDNYDLTKYGYDLTLSTGYSPISDKNISKNVINEKYNIIKKYENKARKINNSSSDWQTIKKKLAKNLEKFVDEIVNS